MDANHGQENVNLADFRGSHPIVVDSLLEEILRGREDQGGCEGYSH